jgi:hypothetical protein
MQAPGGLDARRGVRDRARVKTGRRRPRDQARFGSPRERFGHEPRPPAGQLDQAMERNTALRRMREREGDQVHGAADRLDGDVLPDLRTARFLHRGENLTVTFGRRGELTQGVDRARRAGGLPNGAANPTALVGRRTRGSFELGGGGAESGKIRLARLACRRQGGVGTSRCVPVRAPARRARLTALGRHSQLGVLPCWSQRRASASRRRASVSARVRETPAWDEPQERGVPSIWLLLAVRTGRLRLNA